MNPLKKIYCRIFQNVFKFALPFLPYRNPKIIGSLKDVPAVLEKKKCETVLIITDAGIHKLGLTDRLEKALNNSDISYVLYDKTVPNPTTDNVAEALELYKANDCLQPSPDEQYELPTEILTKPATGFCQQSRHSCQKFLLMIKSISTAIDFHAVDMLFSFSHFH